MIIYLILVNIGFVKVVCIVVNGFFEKFCFSNFFSFFKLGLIKYGFYGFWRICFKLFLEVFSSILIFCVWVFWINFW